MNHRYLVLITLFLLPMTVFAGDGSYKKTLKKWTRSGECYRYQDLHAAIIWNATLLTDEMILAQTKKYAKTYDLKSAGKAAFLESLRQKRKGGTLFFVSFYSYDRRFSDLKNPEASWDLRLETGESQIKPTHMDPIGRITPLDILLYPYVNVWSRGYYVWFPISIENLSFPVILSVYGPQASSSLTWE